MAAPAGKGMSETSLSHLEAHLWASANILRGPVNAADFKTYIFPLLFFKRICDVWDEEYQEIVDESGDAELALFPESHRFQIPDGCHIEAKTAETPIIVERVVTDIDEIVRLVRFLGWQGTLSGEREVKKALRKTLFHYRLH